MTKGEIIKKIIPEIDKAYNQAIDDAIKVVAAEMTPGLVANELLNDIKRKLFALIK